MEYASWAIAIIASRGTPPVVEALQRELDTAPPFLIQVLIQESSRGVKALIVETPRGLAGCEREPARLLWEIS
jgi:hypothetical protein